MTMGIRSLAILGVAAFVAVKLVDHFSKGTATPKPQGFSVTDMKGRELILNTGKNGYLYDQYGGLWT